MFNNLKIGKRLALAFGVSIILVAVAGLTGFWGLSQTVETTYGILHHDAKLMQEASAAQVNGLQLRRYEKDTFLNIGDQQKSADYSEKWKKEHEELDAHLNTLEQATTLPADKETGARHTRRPFHLHDRLPVGRAADFREDDQVFRGRQRRDGAVQGRHPPHGYRARRVRREKHRAHEFEREGRRSIPRRAPAAPCGPSSSPASSSFSS